jgi:hypothetical protein
MTEISNSDLLVLIDNLQGRVAYLEAVIEKLTECA